MFLTLNEQGKLKVNCILMPSYTDVNDQNLTYKLNLFPFTIEWNKCKTIFR